MSEIITTYNPTQPETALPKDRVEFYKEQFGLFDQNKKPDTASGIVNIFFFDNSGELFIQKRSDNKSHNAGLLDKAVGGHITYGDAPDYTVMVETIQEIQVPSIVTKDEAEFTKTYDLLKNYLDSVAVVKHVEDKIFKFDKNIKGLNKPILNKVHLYFGIYTGAVKTVDREAKGVLLYSLEDLDREMQQFPDKFTDDLKILLKYYRSQIVAFIKVTKSK